jgi:predicted transcriptional regulator
MAELKMQIDDNTFSQLEELAGRSGRTPAEEAELAIQAHVLTELERHAREVAGDPKSPPA